MKKGSVSIISARGIISYDVRIVDRRWERRIGLMGCERLPAGTGMLFLFDEPEYVRLWMKNVPISIDMICINYEKKISFLYENRTPLDETPHYPDEPIFAMLEVNARECQKNEFKIGQKIEWIINPKEPSEYSELSLDF